MGLRILAHTPGSARFLLPPALITMGVFAIVFRWLWSWLHELTAALEQADPRRLEGWPEWLRWPLEWALTSGLLSWIGGMGQILLFLIISLSVALLTFSIVYELVSGPFLDELHGRIEEDWFGADPRDRATRPNDIPGARCLQLSLSWIVVAGALSICASRLEGPPRMILALLALLAPLLALRLDPRYGPWLRWVLLTEGRSLWVSLRATLASTCLLLAFLWLYLVPFVGSALFFMLTGFVTAIGLLDIPFSRRRFTLRQELAFARRHLGALTAFGALAALVFLLPIIGPLLMLPCASVGGLWLICRLDKADL